MAVLFQFNGSNPFLAWNPKHATTISAMSLCGRCLGTEISRLSGSQKGEHKTSLTQITVLTNHPVSKLSECFLHHLVCVFKNGFTPNQWVLYGFDLLSFFQKAFGRSFNHVQSHQSVIYPIIQVFQVISTCFFFHHLVPYSISIIARAQRHAPACLCTSVTPPLSSDQLSSVESVRGGGQRPRGRSGAGESWILETFL